MRFKRHEYAVSEKTIELAVVADRMMLDHHGRKDLLPYLLTVMNVVRERMRKRERERERKKERGGDGGREGGREER